MAIISYDNLNNLSETSFIAGTDQLWTYTCYNTDGVTLLNISSGTVLWYLCPFGQFSINTLTKSGTITTANTFTVALTAADTVLLSGKFIQQPIITDFSGNTFRPGQGIVLILPAIPTT